MRRPLLAPLLGLMAALAAACAGSPSPVGDVRFFNRAPVTVVNDRCDVPDKPAEYALSALLYAIDADIFHRIPRLLDFKPYLRARSQNAMDEVPDSTWFTNRIGHRPMTPEEIRRGPNDSDGPDRSAPWRIIGSKTAGISAGFRVKDARDDVWLIKFDEPHLPEMETATEVIVQRLVWAAGYNVPETAVVLFERDQLELAADAVIEDQFGNDRPMEADDLAQVMARIEPMPDGRYRALASKYIPGTPIGGIRPEGTRPDDPNDTIPHELRRELRGMYALYAWLNNVDTKLGNTLDTYIEDPAREGHHYVVHYFLDFGKSLGVHASSSLHAESGFQRKVAPEKWLATVAALGLEVQPWDNLEQPPNIRGVARFESERFDPGDWHTLHPWLPFENSDRFDQYWGTKIVMAFTPEQLRAAIDVGQLSDPRAADYYLRILRERQEKTGRYWFSRVAPLEDFEVTREQAGSMQLCFRDLWLRHGFDASPNRTRYTARSYDYLGRPASLALSASPTDEGSACLTNVSVHSAEDSYTIVGITVTRAGKSLPPVFVHLARGQDGRLRVIGIWRT